MDIFDKLPVQNELLLIIISVIIGLIIGLSGNTGINQLVYVPLFWYVSDPVYLLFFL